MNRREAIYSLAAFTTCLSMQSAVSEARCPALDSDISEFHGHAMQNLIVDGCEAHLVRPSSALAGNPWVWRAMFWDQFPGVDLALLSAGFHLAFIDVGNTFGCPDAMKHFDAFHQVMVQQYGLASKPALEGLSRGGLYIYRWAYVNSGKVGCLYGDAPVCDLKSWPGGKGRGRGDAMCWQEAIRDYHFSGEQEMMAFKGNPVDILAPIAKAKIPILHVCGDADDVVPRSENTALVRARYLAMRGSFALIVKQGCGHHPHGLSDPKPIVDFILANCASGQAADQARGHGAPARIDNRAAPSRW